METHTLQSYCSVDDMGKQRVGILVECQAATNPSIETSVYTKGRHSIYLYLNCQPLQAHKTVLSRTSKSTHEEREQHVEVFACIGLNSERYSISGRYRGARTDIIVHLYSLTTVHISAPNSDNGTKSKLLEGNGQSRRHSLSLEDYLLSLLSRYNIYSRI